MSIHNLNEYQRSKVIVSELEKILKILTIAQSGLKRFKHFRPVQAILTTIYNEKALMELYLEEHRMIVQTKGQRGL